MACTRLAVCRRNQFVQDAASGLRMARIATLAQFGQLSLQRAHGLKPRPYPQKLRFDQAVNITTYPPWLIQKLKQLPHIGERDIERAAMANESKPLKLLFTISTIAVALSLWRGQQPLPLVIPYGFRIHAGCRGQLSDTHDGLHVCSHYT